MDSLIDLSDPSQALDLESIRFQLIRLEDTITFHLIERAQFPLNKTIYIPGALNIPNSGLSLMDWYLREQESLQSMIRRYEAPDEFPFFPAALRKPILKPLNYPPVLHQHNINVNDKILPYYVDRFLPAVCPKFDREDRGESEENYGSAATCDILCLQAISRRIHFGNYVAESKFRSDPEKYTQLIRDKDEAGIYMSITNNAVEKKLLERIRLKVLTYGREPSAQGTASPAKINVDAVVEGYRDFIIPLTKEVEIAYLMQRVEPRD